MISETLTALVDRFNRRASQNPSVQEELQGLERTITLRLTDEGSYSIDLAGGRLQNLRSIAADHPDVTIVTDQATFRALMAKEMGPMKALVTRKLTIEGSLEDKLLFRRLLGPARYGRKTHAEMQTP